MILFSNPGEIDIRAVTMLGVNVKPASHGSPIGYFGTGVKYAIAVLLREEQAIEIWSGRARYGFTKSEEVIRGESFWRVMMNGEPCGWSTGLGRNWTLEDAYRELWSNMRDEGGASAICFEEDELSEWHGVENETAVLVSGEAFAGTHASRHDFLLLDRGGPLWRGHGLEVYPGESTTVFYHGIKAVRDTAHSPTFAFTYNITEQMTLTEDRTFADFYAVRTLIGKALLQCTSEEVCEGVLASASDASFDFDWSSILPSGAFVEAVLARMRSHLSTPDSARAALRRLDSREVREALELDGLVIPERWEDMAQGEPPLEGEEQISHNGYRLEARIESLTAQVRYWKGCARRLAEAGQSPEEREETITLHSETGRVTSPVANMEEVARADGPDADQIPF